jgi:ABC-type transport system substrate-binding protein
MHKKRFWIALLLVMLVSMIGQLVVLAQDAPTVGGTLVIAVPNDFDTLDIHKTGDGNAMSAGWLMGATLVFRDVDASYKPWLAESWETSDDGLIWTFHLRQDVKFHDGTPLTANDYAWTISRLLNPETAAARCSQRRRAGRLHAATDAGIALPDPAGAAFQHGRRAALLAGICRGAGRQLRAHLHGRRSL